MTHRLATNYAKNYCNRTPIVKVIVENVVTCFFGTQCIQRRKYGTCTMYGSFAMVGIVTDWLWTCILIQNFYTRKILRELKNSVFKLQN